MEPVAHNRNLVIVLGPPAAGKSTIASEIAVAHKAAILDSDEIKKSLPEFGGEVQIWPPGKLEAQKAGGGYKLYEVSRDPLQPETACARAVEEMKALYGAAADGLDPSFAAKLGTGAPSDASAAAASAADNSVARSSPNTSSAIGREPPSGTQTLASDSIIASPVSDATQRSDLSLKNFIGAVPPFGQDVSNIGGGLAKVNPPATARLVTDRAGDDPLRESGLDVQPGRER